MTITRLADSSAECDDSEVMYQGINKMTRDNGQAKTGSYSWKAGASSNWIGLGYSAVSGMRTGFHLYHTGITGDLWLCAVHETLTANWPVYVKWMEDELRLDLTINGVVQDQVSTASIGFDVGSMWYHLGMIADRSAGFASVYLDGVQILTYSGAITGGNWDATIYSHRVQTNGYSGAGGYHDNIYVDGISSEADNAPPAYEFLPSYPNGAVTAGWTVQGAASNWQAVDDGATPDGDTTYNRVSTSAGALEDRHDTSAIVLPADYIIVAALPYVVAKKLDSADDAEIEPSAHDGVTGAYGSSWDIATSYKYIRNRMTTQPDTTAWNETDFNNMRFGYRASGSF